MFDGKPAPLELPGGANETTELSPTAWGLRRLNIPALWELGLTGTGVRVGHLDTGVDGEHPSLRGRIAAFAEFDPQGCRVEGAAPHDSGIHGTHTAGIICGRSLDGISFGAAPDAELCSGMVIEGGKSLVRLLAGLDWLFDCQIRVLCVSIGIPGYLPLFEIILSRMMKAGVLVVAPAGNRGAGQTCSPANYPGVLAVGALNQSNRRARFSGSGAYRREQDPNKPNLLAPGVDIPSCLPGGLVRKMSGTSMAAAYTAGAAALLFQAKPKTTASEMQQALLATCTALAVAGQQRCGCGLLNPLKALDFLTGRERRA